MLEPDVKGPVANHWELDFSCRQRLGHNKALFKNEFWRSISCRGHFRVGESGGKETRYKTIAAAHVKLELRKWLWDKKETFGG